MLNSSGTHGEVIIAFVGTFHDSYSGANKTNGALYQDGKRVNEGWYNALLVQTTDKKWRIVNWTEFNAIDQATVVTAVSNTPRLIRGGVKEVVGEGTDENFMEATAQRTLVGVKADGTLIVATGSANFDRAADALLELGCVDAMAMDGGASSFLYADGTTLQSAGRNLNNIIAVYAAPTSNIINSSAPAPTSDTISVTINGTAVSFSDQQPANMDGRVLVPVRGVFETLGFDVSWNPDLRQATLARENDTIVITLGSATFTTNGVSHTLDVPAQSIGGSTMLPLRAVLESVGYNLDWEANSRTVLISGGRN